MPSVEYSRGLVAVREANVAAFLTFDFVLDICNTLDFFSLRAFPQSTNLIPFAKRFGLHSASPLTVFSETAVQRTVLVTSAAHSMKRK